MSSENKEQGDIEKEEEVQTGSFEVVDAEESDDNFEVIAETKETLSSVEDDDEAKVAPKKKPLIEKTEENGVKDKKIISWDVPSTDKVEDSGEEEEKDLVVQTTSSTPEVPVVETASNTKEEDAVVADEKMPLLSTKTEEASGKGGTKYAATIITLGEDPNFDVESAVSSEASSVKPIKPRPKIVRQTSKAVQVVYEDSIKPLVAKVSSQKDRVLRQAGESTRKLSLETKKMKEKVGQETKKMTDKVGQETIKVVGVVRQQSVRAVTHVNNETKKIATQVGDGTKRAADRVSNDTKRALEYVDKEVKPAVQRQAFILNGTAESLRTTEEDKVIVQICDGTARSFGLVVFCDNPMSGCLIWIAMMITHPLCGTCALLCSFLTNLIAYLIDLDLSLIRRGNLSTNAVLVGSGLISYLTYQGFWGAFTLVALTVLVAPCASLLSYAAVSSILQGNKYTDESNEKLHKVPALLFPYVFVMMIMILCAFGVEHVSLRPSIVPPPFGEVGTADGDSKYQFFATVFHGISYIFLPHKPNILAGCFMFVGVITCSRVLAFASLLGSKLGAAVSILCLNVSISTVNSGFMGFNVVLTLMALCYYVIPSWRTLVLGFVGLWFTLGVQVALMKIFSLWSIPIMVLPYCLSMLPFVAFDFKSISNTTKGPFIQTIPLDDLTTPEQHFSIFGKGAVVLPLVEKSEDQKCEDDEDLEAALLIKEDDKLMEKDDEDESEVANITETKEAEKVAEVNV